MKPVRIGTKRWIYAIWSIIGIVVFLVIGRTYIGYNQKDQSELPLPEAFILLIASLFTLISVVQLIRHKPLLVMTTSGIEIKKSLHLYTWEQIRAVKSFCQTADEGDDRYFLALEFHAGKDHNIDVSSLEKNVHEIVALILQYSEGKTIYQGHFTV